MHLSYDDITSRITEEPTWYDANGTPRYGEFSPKQCPNIYSNHVGLFLIACQACGRQFHVEMHSDLWGHRMTVPPSKWHYGDPPRHDGEKCPGGDTMNCDDLAVLEFWTRDMFEWTRRPEFEGAIDGGADS